MSIENDIILNTYLILTAGIVDATWYIILTLLVTSSVALRFIKSKSFLLQTFVGYVFILIGLLLLTQFLLENFHLLMS